MNELDKNRLLMTKLIQETQKDTLIWHSSSDKNIVLSFDGEIVDKIYTTTFKGTRFRLFRFKYKDYDSSLVSYFYQSAVRLDIIDYNDNAEWSFPLDNSLNDLYETVRFKVSNVDNIIDDLLGIEIIKAEYLTSKKSIDVTKRLNDLIVNNELHIVVSNEIAGDPEYGSIKTLKIKYFYKGKFYEKEIKEGQRLDIPQNP